MTRKEAYEFYDELKKTGKLKEFQRKRPSEMTKKEQDLFYYDDGKVMYNPFVGVLDEIVPFEDDDKDYKPILLTEERKKSIRFISWYENKVIFGNDARRTKII